MQRVKAANKKKGRSERMSHYTQIELEFTDGESLKRALEQIGFLGNVECYATPQNLYGYHGDLRQQKAHIIIRRVHIGHASNDIGFERLPNGKYVAHISEYDAKKYGKEWIGKLKQFYGCEVAIKGAVRQGWNVYSKAKKQDGTVQVVLMRN